MCWDASDLYRQTMWEKLPVDNFELDKNTQKSDAKFENNYDENSGYGYIFESNVKYFNELLKNTIIYHFLHTEWKLKSVKNFYVIYMINKSMFCI